MLNKSDYAKHIQFKLENGEWPGMPPIGYKTHEGKRDKFKKNSRVMADENKELVIDIFESFAYESHSLTSLTEYINKKWNTNRTF